MTTINEILHARYPSVRACYTHMRQGVVMSDVVRALLDSGWLMKSEIAELGIVPPPFSPEVSALVYYALNEAVGVIEARRGRFGALTDDEAHIVEDYDRVVRRLGTAVAWYSIVVASREARHASPGLKNMKSTVIDDGIAVGSGLEETGQPAVMATLLQRLTCRFGAGAVSILDGMYELSSVGAVKRLLTVTCLDEEEPGCGVLVSDYLSALYSLFMYGAWNGALGGVAWASCVRPALDFYLGRSSVETMIDGVYQAQHNTSQVMNKGMIFRAYDHEALPVILDCQRAGEVIPLIYTAIAGYDGAPDSIKSYVTTSDALWQTPKSVASAIKIALGDDAPWRPVDWKAVNVDAEFGVYSGLIKNDPKVKFKVVPGEHVEIVERVA